MYQSRVIIVVIALCITCCGCWATSTHSQSPSESLRTFAEQFNQRQSALGHEINLPNLNTEDIALLSVVDPKVLKAYEDATVGIYQYLDKGYQHRSKVFAWQLWSSKIIFWMVMFLVMCGIYFAWMQFKAAYSPENHLNANDSDSSEETQGAAPIGGSIKLSKAGIEVSSPVLGIIILAISLAFFFLFLEYVYPIEDSF